MLGKLLVIQSQHDLEMPGEEKKTKGVQTKEVRGRVPRDGQGGNAMFNF